jgi:hypothetical protein
MKISRWKKGVSLDKLPGQMITISKREAYLLIQSLSNQLVNETSNSGRWECNAEVDKHIEYFSIAIDSTETIDLID